MGRSRINAWLGMKADYRLEDAEVRSRRLGIGIVGSRGQVYRLEKL
jgi:hypothetical protein